MTDTRTHAQRKQHALWSLLGTLARTKATLNSMARYQGLYPLTRNFLITPLEQRILDAAVYVLGDMTNRAREQMKNLPSKKNLKTKKIPVL